MVFRYGSLLKNTTSGLQIPWVSHPRLEHFRPSADGETDTANARPLALAAEAYLWTRSSSLTETQGQDSAQLQQSPALGTVTATVRGDQARSLGLPTWSPAD